MYILKRIFQLALISYQVLLSLNSFAEDVIKGQQIDTSSERNNGRKIRSLHLTGSNPELTHIGRSSKDQGDFSYHSYGVRQVGLGYASNNDLILLSFNDPRDSDSQRTQNAMIEYRSFGPINWGIEIMHFKGFGLYNGTNVNEAPVENRADLESFSSQLFIVKNLNNPNYSIETALKSLSSVSESGWAWTTGAHFTNTYIQADQPLIPAKYNLGSVTSVNSLHVTAMIGIGGTLVFGPIYTAAQLNLGLGPSHAKWKDGSSTHERVSWFSLSHVVDLVLLGYSSDRWSFCYKIFTISDSTVIETLSIQNLSSNTSLNLAYRF